MQVAAGLFGCAPGHMQYNLAHSSPEIVTGHLSALSVERMDATAQDMWGIGLLFLFTLTQRIWFAPHNTVNIAAGVQALHIFG